MNSQNSKSEAIKAAYGEHWDKVKDYVDEDGWIKLYSYNYNRDIIYTDLTEDLPFLKEEGYERKYYDKGHTHYVRPNSLYGIETNNGWNKVEFDSNGNLLDKDSLPKKTGEYNIINRWGMPSKYILKSDQNDKNVRDWQWSKYTHWKPAEAIKPPIF